jgi:hypothetical protein
LGIFKDIHGNNDNLVIADLWSKIGDIHFILNDYSEAVYEFKQVLRIQRLFHESDQHPEIVDTLNKLRYSQGELNTYSDDTKKFLKELRIQKLRCNENIDDIYSEFDHTYSDMNDEIEKLPTLTEKNPNSRLKITLLNLILKNSIFNAILISIIFYFLLYFILLIKDAIVGDEI